MAYKTRSKIKTTSFTEKDSDLIDAVVEAKGEKSYSDWANKVLVKEAKKDAKRLNISEE